MLRYKSDLNIDANNGQGKVIFRASKIECPCVITSPNIEEMNARLDALAAVVGSSSSPTSAPSDPGVSSALLSTHIERVRADIVTLLARQDALEAALATALATALAKPSPTNGIFNARLNSLADDVAKLTSAIERIERRPASVDAGQVVVSAQPEVDQGISSEPVASDDVKRITTPDGRVITLRRTPPTGKTVQYAW